MDQAEIRERYGRAFEAVAEEYDHERRAYAPELLDAACTAAGLGTGSLVLEVGCGTGLLTEALVARGLVVDAIDPGPEMVKVARRRVGADAPVQFRVERFEDAEIPAGSYAAVFSASAWHWLDPAVSWQRAHAALVPGGRLCLLQDFSVWDEPTAAKVAPLVDALARAAPEIAAAWPRARDAETLRRGAEQRRANVSEVWSWLGSMELARPEAAELFDDVQITALPLVIDQTADELNAYFRTTSFHARLTSVQREQVEADNRRLADALGGRLRHRQLAALVSGRRA